MDKDLVLERIEDAWLVAIMRGETPEETDGVCDALVAGGLRLIEVPFTVPEGPRVIRSLRARHGDRILVSAGTVTTAAQAEEALESGAEAIVSPNLFPPVVEAALRRGAVSMPGCVTPTEVADAVRLGADLIKLFPCYNLGPEHIGYLLGPYPGLRVVPAGAVTLENMESWARAGAFAAVVGATTEMGLRDAVERRDYDRVAETARGFARKAEETAALRPGARIPKGR